MKASSSTLRILSLLLGVCITNAGFTQETPSGLNHEAPSEAEQTAMLAAMRQYAEQYISGLPNFICAQVTQQFEAGRKATHWHKGDTLRSKLVFAHGSEERSLELVNNKPPGPGRRWRAPLTTEGEFGILLANVFGESSEASFRWREWETIRGKRVAVFDYTVDREHSTLKLTLSDLAHSVVPYHGSVYADPSAGSVWRISNSAFDIPPEVRTKSISTVIEYDQVPIGGREYLLPVEATVSLDTGSNNVRNDISFSEYRKFETDSSVTYTSDDQMGRPVTPDSHP